MTTNEVFYGKIILFGEYGIIFDSMALTIPFSHFHGELSFDNKNNKYKYTDYDFALNSNNQLREYAANLSNLSSNVSKGLDLNLEAFQRDLDEGLYFESTIPQGYGLGSSGALVAALYNQYANNKIEGVRTISKSDTLKLKEVFSTMENFFHGKSSGIDPLNSYIKFPLLINSKTDIETVGIPRNKFDSNAAIFLVNTGKIGKTEPLVNLFLEHCKNSDYLDSIKNEYIPLNNKCILHLINGEMDDFFKCLTILSAFQYRSFSDMIPEDFKGYWKDGIDSNYFNLKLCGSGGGGYLLGFTTDLPKTQQYFNDQHVDIVTVYKS
ncbi:MAG: hypothetical protein R2764_20575 [Bacteroidales bacterium]